MRILEEDQVLLHWGYKIRNNYLKTHPKGTIITFECSGFTQKGVPRFGRYVRKRDDVIIKDHIEDPDSHITIPDV